MSTPAEKINQPDYRCKAYGEMLPAVTLVRDVCGGTPAIRGKRHIYLPEEPGERLAEYNARLGRSVFFPATPKTLNALVGMVLKENPKPGGDIPKPILLHLENIDLAGSHIDVFAKELFTDAMTDGHAFAFVDMQTALPKGATRADEIASGRRPYWVKRTKSQAINWRPVVINGEQVIGQITFEECSTEPDGRYGEKEVIRYRTLRLPLIDAGLDEKGRQVRPAVYGPARWEILRKTKGASNLDQFILEGEGEFGLPRIPVAVTYGHRTGFLESEPPLLHLAYLNIDHYQQNSDYRTQLHRLVPILLRTGVPQELLDQEATRVLKGGQPQLLVGAGCLTDQPTESDLKYVSHDPDALEGAHQAIMDSEQRMSAAGVSIIAAKHDREITLGEKQMDQSERTSDLSMAARSLKDCLESCLGFDAQFMNLADKNGDGGSIDLGVSDDLVLDSQDLAIANQMVDSGRLTVETLHLLASKRWRVDLAEEIDALKKQEAEKAKELAKQPPQQMPPMPPVPAQRMNSNGGVQ